MREQMLEYFLAEKRESLFFMAAGIAGLVASVYLFRSASPYRGMIGPLAVVAVIQLAVGAGVYFRTDGQVAGLK